MEYIQDKSLLEKYYIDQKFGVYFGLDIRPYTSVVRFEPEDIILKEGETPKKLYFLFRGRAKLFMSHKNGTVDLINYLRSPCFIGEMELFDQARPAKGVIALTVCECFCIDISMCREKLLSDVTFLQNVCRFLSDKNSADIMNYSRNQAYPLKVKLASFILMTENAGTYREKHTEACAYLGVTYRHLLYVMAEFVKNGILEKRESGYKIKDFDRLRELAEQTEASEYV